MDNLADRGHQILLGRHRHKRLIALGQHAQCPVDALQFRRSLGDLALQFVVRFLQRGLGLPQLGDVKERAYGAARPAAFVEKRRRVAQHGDGATVTANQIKLGVDPRACSARPQCGSAASPERQGVRLA